MLQRTTTKNAQVNTELAITQARSILGVAALLQNILNAVLKLQNPNPLTALGCTLSTTLLRSFAAEIALKCLYVQETNRDPKRTHDLSELFQELSPATRQSLDQRFQHLRHKNDNRNPGPTTINQVFLDHKDDFVGWRYIYFSENTNPSQIEFLDLEPAVEAVINEFTDGSL